MKTIKRLGVIHTLFATLAVICGWYSMFPAFLGAQTNYQGYNAVIGGVSSTPCATGNICPSSAFIDASVFNLSDPCAQVHAALLEAVSNGLPGAVIDARGLTLISCASNPWNGISIPNTVLLPAGTMTVSTAWTIPSGTKIVGEGIGMTNLEAGSGITPLITMGSGCPTLGCIGVGIQDLTLTQTNSNSIAIDNENSQGQSYVQHVAIFVNTTNTVTGLKINAPNSGPYEDVTFYGLTNTTAGSGRCVWITDGASGIRVHGLNCMGTVDFTAAVQLDGSNDSLEDVYISNNYTDGILVGASTNNVSNDVLQNITGGLTNSVHLCGASGGSGACAGTGNTVSDMSLLGIARGGATNSIKDEVTSTTLTDATVATYILGEQATVDFTVPVFAYARFTTSKSTATWGAGGTAPSGNCTTAPANTKGALFSNTSGTGNSGGCTTAGPCAFWVCTGSGWKGVY